MNSCTIVISWPSLHSVEDNDDNGNDGDDEEDDADEDDDENDDDEDEEDDESDGNIEIIHDLNNDSVELVPSLSQCSRWWINDFLSVSCQTRFTSHKKIEYWDKSRDPISVSLAYNLEIRHPRHRNLEANILVILENNFV